MIAFEAHPNPIIGLLLPEQIQDQRSDDTEHDARHNREVKAAPLALNSDVARQLPEGNPHLLENKDNSADERQSDTQDNESLS